MSEPSLSSASVVIRPVEPRDNQRLADIYNHYIEHTYATFELDPVTADYMAERVSKVTEAALPWLVAEDAERVVGYSYANVWNIRPAYRHTVESSIYLDAAVTGRGVGSMLYERLFNLLKQKSLRIVIGGVALPNAASVALHERFGFGKVAHFKEVGFKFDQWIDVGYWQVHLANLDTKDV